MPQAMTIPRRLVSTGRSTAASLGPSLTTPTSGLITLPACTSWSYWRMIHSLLQTFSEPRMLSRAGVKSERSVGGRGDTETGRRGADCYWPDSRVSSQPASTFGRPAPSLPFSPLPFSFPPSHTASRTTGGRPSWRNSIARLATSWP